MAGGGFVSAPIGHRDSTSAHGADTGVESRGFSAQLALPRLISMDFVNDETDWFDYVLDETLRANFRARPLSLEKIPEIEQVATEEAVIAHS